MSITKTMSSTRLNYPSYLTCNWILAKLMCFGKDGGGGGLNRERADCGGSKIYLPRPGFSKLDNANSR